MSAQHTPSTLTNSRKNPLRILSESYGLLAIVEESHPNSAEYAAFIVRACNLHKDMVEALEVLLAVSDKSSLMFRKGIGSFEADALLAKAQIVARAALAKAKP